MEDRGGAIMASNGTFSVSNSNFNVNASEFSGAISDQFSTISIIDSTFVANTAVGGSGEILNYNASNAYITNSSLFGNQATKNSLVLLTTNYQPV